MNWYVAFYVDLPSSQRSYISTFLVRAVGVDLANLPTHLYHIQTFIGTKTKHVKKISPILSFDSTEVKMRLLVEDDLFLEHKTEGVRSDYQKFKKLWL